MRRGSAREESKVTRDEVYQAVQELEARGEPISHRRILALTGGSMRDVSRFMKQLLEEDMMDSTTAPLLAVEEDEDESAALDEGPAPAPVRSGPRRPLGGERCALCGEPVGVHEMIATITSCMPSILDAELTMQPLRQVWDRQCLLLFAESWKARHQKEHRP
jgi:hypothetical protein